MKRLHVLQRVFGLMLTAFIAVPAMAQQETIIAEGQESVVYDTATGNYVFTYINTDDPSLPEGASIISKSIYIPRTKMDPLVASSFRLNNLKEVVYRYTIKNREKEKFKQNLMSFRVHAMSLKNTTFSTNTPALLKPIYDNAANLPPSEFHQRLADSVEAAAADARQATASTPPGWEGEASPMVGRTGIGVWWGPKPFEEKYGLPPGKTLSGFGFTSEHLPGVGTAILRGYAPVFGWKNRGGPSNDAVRWVANDIMKKGIALERYVAVPSFAVTSPFDAAALLERLKKHASADLAKYKLIDPAFASQIEPWFTAAIDAARRNNNEGVRYQTREIRRLLKQEQPDVDKGDDDDLGDERKSRPAGRIDRLAARVLDFNLRYVERQLGEKK